MSIEEATGADPKEATASDAPSAVPAGQRGVDFMGPLERKLAPKRPQHSLRGLWADLDISLSEEEIDQMRRECWNVASGTKD